MQSCSTKTVRKAAPKKIPRPSNAWILYRSATIRAFRLAETQGNEYILPQKVLDALEEAGHVFSNAAGICRTSANPIELQTIISTMWKQESEDVKKEFHALSALEKKKHSEMYPDYVYAPKRKRSATVAAPNVSPLPISLDISPLPRPASPPSHALSFGSMLSPSPASSSKRKRLSSDLFHNGNEQNVEADHSFMARRLGDSTEMERMCSWSGSELSDMTYASSTCSTISPLPSPTFEASAPSFFFDPYFLSDDKMMYHQPSTPGASLAPDYTGGYSVNAYSYPDYQPFQTAPAYASALPPHMNTYQSYSSNPTFSLFSSAPLSSSPVDSAPPQLIGGWTPDVYSSGPWYTHNQPQEIITWSLLDDEVDCSAGGAMSLVAPGYRQQ